MEGSTAKKGKSDADVRAEETARTGVEGVEGSPTSVVDISTRNATRADQARAGERGIYKDAGGARRVVAAGDPIPDGWSKIEDGDLAGRSAETARGPKQPAGHGIEDKAQRGPRGR